jgi:hypothetical protein
VNATLAIFSLTLIRHLCAFVIPLPIEHELVVPKARAIRLEYPHSSFFPESEQRHFNRQRYRQAWMVLRSMKSQSVSGRKSTRPPILHVINTTVKNVISQPWGLFRVPLRLL